MDSFYLTVEQLENSPSRSDGIDKDTEGRLRMYGCELIQEAGILLSFHQVVMATAQVLLHRFYCKRSMKTFNIKKVAATALWVGAKLEEVSEVKEHPRKLLEMVMVAVDRCITRRETPKGQKLPILDLHSKEGEEFRRSLIRYEAEMLRAFGFIMNVEHPHRLLCNYCQVLFMPFSDVADKKEFVVNFIQEAWNIANDSLRTLLCVRFKGSVTACGIIFFAARRLKVCLPDAWWEIFQVKLEDVCEVCRVLHEVYQAPKATFIPVCHQLLPSKPPTPAIAAGGASAKGAVAATPTPMLGATPEFNMRPGGKPLDPSIRRTMPASESAASLAAAAVVNGGVDGSAAAASPNAAAAPGSARKRSRSRSPRSPADPARKRQELDKQQPGASPAGASQQEQQLQQQARDALAAAAAAAAAAAVRGSAGDRDKSPDRDRDRSRRVDCGGSDRGSHRPRSRSRERSRRSRSRDKSRRSRSRDRGRRSRSRDKSKRSRSRSRDKSRRSRSRDRSRRSRSRSRGRRSRSRDRRGRSYRNRPEQSKPDRGRETKSPVNTEKRPLQQEQQELVFPSPPADPAATFSPSKAAQPANAGPAGGGKVPVAAVAAAGGSKENLLGGGTANGVGGGHRDGQAAPVKHDVPKGATEGADRSGRPPVQPKTKPVAVRKKPPVAGAVTSPVTSPTAQQDKPSSAAHAAGSD